jgi:aconitate hydratase
MLFESREDYEKIEQDDLLEIEGFFDQIPTRRVVVKDVTKGFAFNVRLELTDSEMAVVLAGGQLRYLKDQLVKEGVIKES